MVAYEELSQFAFAYPACIAHSSSYSLTQPSSKEAIAAAENEAMAATEPVYRESLPTDPEELAKLLASATSDSDKDRILRSLEKRGWYTLLSEPDLIPTFTCDE